MVIKKEKLLTYLLTYCKFNFGFNLMFKGQICYTEMKKLLQFTINGRKSFRQPQCTCNSCAKIACCSSELIFTLLYADSCFKNCDPAIYLLYPTFLFTLSVHPSLKKI